MNTPTATEQKLQSTLDVSYRNKNPLRTLWQLFNGRHAQLLLVCLLYIMKTSPMIVLPIVTGNIITQITAVYAAHALGHSADPHAVGRIIINAVIMLVLIAQNVPMHTLYASCLCSACAVAPALGDRRPIAAVVDDLPRFRPERTPAE